MLFHRVAFLAALLAVCPAHAIQGDTFACGTRIPRPEIVTLWERYHSSRDIDSRNQLVEAYLSIVKYQTDLMGNRLPDSVDTEDLASAGVLGLMDAIAAFDPQRGVKFETYCVPRIRGAMLDQLRREDWVPRLVRSQTSKLKQAQEACDLKLGRAPTDEELADHMKISLEAFAKLRRDTRAVNIDSLDRERFTNDSGRSRTGNDENEDSNSESPAQNIEQLDAMRVFTRGLSKEERLIILMYYWEKLTMKEISLHLGLSESRISQMHKAIRNRLRQKNGYLFDQLGMDGNASKN